MPIVEDLSSLPSGDDIEGWPPDADPRIVSSLVAEFHRQYVEAGEDHKEMAVEGARWRASWAAGCARATGYDIRAFDAKRELAEAVAVLGSLDFDDLSIAATSQQEQVDRLAEAVVMAEPTDPLTTSDYWRFSLGTFVHEVMQKIAADAFPGAEAEVQVRIDDFGAAHVDLVIDELRYAEVETGDEGVQGDAVPFRTVVEIKSVNGFGYKMMATNFKGKPEGPRTSAVTQGAVAAEALGADRLVVAVFSLELLSPDVAARAGVGELGRMAAQWTLTSDQFLPIAVAERKRVRRIIEIVDEGKLPPRHAPEMPSGARITDPGSGAWTVVNDDGQVVRAGKHWLCAYCHNQRRCVADGPS